MGFLDKAKQMAKDLDVEKAKQMAKQATDQAQAKIDEVQGNFNQGQSGGGAQAGQGPATEYDKHGRPVPPAGGGDTPAPPAPPVAPAAEAPATPTADAAAPAAQDAPADDAPPPQPPAASAPKPPAPPSEAPAAPRGDDGPKPMTSGDPLAG